MVTQINGLDAVRLILVYILELVLTIPTTDLNVLVFLDIVVLPVTLVLLDIIRLTANQ